MVRTMNPNPAKAIFLEAVERHAPDQWPAFLDRACAGRPELRGQVEALLAAHREVGTAAHQELVDADPDPAVTVDLPPVSVQPGAVVGPYKLVEPIGEGGMGSVWMAQQTEPVKRLVAVKLIKAGMDSKQVIARFEAERQALALMDHPNIARVLDAGTTPAGRPYFVMDLVRGVPITRYCDEHHLTPRQRLELFVPVCQAIQHAHQKGVIHRDIKPSNVLVALYDGRPVPKVIDFGIAKAAGQALTDKTLVTGFGAIVGTMEYMSPEQAEVNQLDIDTRSDIYSLGVLMYELLAGSPPFTRKELEKAGVLEMLRVIREQEPSKPSTKLSTAEGLPTLAANRGTEPAKLTKLVRGELDWIVMKALEKDRTRRYETANGFAADVQRYLADEPVLACPPSAGYRIRKFARRNKGGLAAASVVLFFLMVLGTGAGWAARDRAARRAHVAGQVESILAEVDRREAEQDWPGALAAARQAEAAAVSGGADEETAERVRQRLKDLEFIDRLEQVRMLAATWVEGKFDNAGADREYARAFRNYGVDVEELAVETAVERLRARPAIAIPVAAALQDWANLRRPITSDGYSNALSKRLIAIARGIDPDPLRDWLRSRWGQSVSADELRRVVGALDLRAHHPTTLYTFASRLLLATDRDAAIKLLRDVQVVYPADFWANFNLAQHLDEQKDYEGAVRFYTAAVSVRPRATAALNNLGNTLLRQKKLDEAIAVYRRALEIDANFAAAHNGLGIALKDQDKLDEAITHFRRASELDPKVGQTNLGILLSERLKVYDKAVAAFRTAVALNPKDFNAHVGLGRALTDMGELDEAIAHYRTALEIDADSSNAHVGLGLALAKQSKLDEAVRHYRRALELDPTNVHAHTNLGLALGRQGKRDQAITHFRTAIEVDPRNANAHGALALSLAIQGKFAEAIPNYRKAVELDPKRADTHFLLGYALARRGELDEAIVHFRTSLKLDPKSADAHEELGAALAEKGKSKEAIPHFRKVIELAPNRPGAHFNLGNALNDNGDFGEAITVLRRAVERDPKHAGAHEVLGNALTSLKKQDDAITHYRKAIEINSKRPETHFRLGIALAAQGDLDKALAHYRKAIELDPRFAEAHSNLGALLCDELGEYDQAIDSFRQVIEINPKLASAASNLRFAQGMKGWSLVSSPDPKRRDPERAIEAVKRAVKGDPRSGGVWQCLGWVQYRLGDWRASVEALEESCRLDNGGDCAQWIVLALAHARLGAQEGLPDAERAHHMTEARRRYEHADQQIDSRWRARPRGGTFQAIWDFRAEARDVLGVKEGKK